MNLNEHLKRIPKRSAAAPARSLDECKAGAEEAKPFIRQHPFKESLNALGAFLCWHDGQVSLCVAFSEQTGEVRVINIHREHRWVKPEQIEYLFAADVDPENISKQLIELFGGVWSQ